MMDLHADPGQVCVQTATGPVKCSTDFQAASTSSVGLAHWHNLITTIVVFVICPPLNAVTGSTTSRLLELGFGPRWFEPRWPASKMGERYVNDIACNKYRLLRDITSQVELIWVLSLLTSRFKTKKRGRSLFFNIKTDVHQTLLLVRRRMVARPARPKPNNAKLPGSGTLLPGSVLENEPA